MNNEAFSGTLSNQSHLALTKISNPISDLVCPYLQCNNSVNDSFLIMDFEQKIIAGCDLMIKRFGYLNISEIRGKTLSEVYLFNQKYPVIIDGITEIGIKAIKENRKINALVVGPFLDNANQQAYFMQQTPLHNQLGNVIGSISTFKEVNAYLSSSLTESIKLNLSFRQAEILFLLSIGTSQKEIASVYSITRGTIARSIEAICSKLRLHGASEKSINQNFINYAYTKFPVALFKPFVTPISHFHINRHIIKYLR